MRKQNQELDKYDHSILLKYCQQSPFVYFDLQESPKLKLKTPIDSTTKEPGWLSLVERRTHRVKIVPAMPGTSEGRGFEPRPRHHYSHSIVPGGLSVIS